MRYNRFLMRALKNLSKSDNLLYLTGSYGMCAGNYNYAGRNYIQLFRKLVFNLVLVVYNFVIVSIFRSQNPFLCLVLGILLVQCCNQKFTAKKKQMTTTALALFTQYANTRGAQALHEVKYNMGRMFHAFGLVHLAQEYYNDVLNYNSPLIDKCPDILDLKREAAYNLHLIYKDSGNFEAARQVLVNHLVI